MTKLSFWAHRMNAYALQVFLVIALLVFLGSAGGVCLLLSGIAVDEPFGTLIGWSPYSGMAAFFVAMVTFATLTNYRANLEALNTTFMMQQMEDVVTQALLTALGGVFQTAPRLKRLAAISEWVTTQVPLLRRDFAEIAATTVIHIKEGLGDDINTPALIRLEQQIDTHQRDVAEGKERLDACKEKIRELMPLIAQAHVLQNAQNDEISSVRRQINELVETFNSIVPQRPSNVTPLVQPAE